MAGRKPKPTALKKLEGNPGKRKLNTIVEVRGTLSDGWGRLKSGAGWICLKYCERI